MNIKTWRKYPICIAGYDVRRWELGMGLAVYSAPFVKKFLFWEKSDSAGPSHIQYRSPFGFLITWPFCVHIWYQFEQQFIDKRGIGIPGSEKVLFISVGWARWQGYDWSYMVPRCYAGLHWD